MDHARGLPVAMERQTVTQYLERWLEDSVRPSVRPLSWESYSQQVRLYLSPAFGRISLAKLNAQHVRAFIADRLKAGLSARTVKYSLVILKLALAQAPQGRTCHAQRCCRC